MDSTRDSDKGIVSRQAACNSRLDNSSFRIATALRFGAPICAPINVSAEKTSTNMVFMVCRAGGPLVVICDTAPSMTS